MTPRSSLLLLAFALLQGCLPTITRVYREPLVRGRVLDLDDFEPIAGARVAHASAPDAFVSTDTEGYFELPSRSAIETRLSMVGTAAQQYSLLVEQAGLTVSIGFTSDLWSSTESTIELEDIVLDSHPSKIGPKPSPDAWEHARFARCFAPGGAMEDTEPEAATRALRSLSVARKLLARYRESESREDPHSSAIRRRVEVQYRRCRELWEELCRQAQRWTWARQEASARDEGPDYSPEQGARQRAELDRVVSALTREVDRAR